LFPETSETAIFDSCMKQQTKIKGAKSRQTAMRTKMKQKTTSTKLITPELCM
jgi:hypothetical protein